jgi:hypothetical protein
MNLLRTQRILLTADAALVGLLMLSFIVEPYSLIGSRGGAAAGEAEAWQPEAIAILKPFDAYQEATAGKAIFRSPLEEEIEAKQKRLIDDFEFLGASRSGSRARGYLRNTETGESRTVSMGDRIGDYEVVGVESNSVLLRKGDETFALGR